MVAKLCKDALAAIDAGDPLNAYQLLRMALSHANREHSPSVSNIMRAMNYLRKVLRLDEAAHA